MPFDVECSTTIAAEPKKVFDVLADFGAWARWMPPSFTPAEWTATKLTPGKMLKMKIGYLPFAIPVEVFVVDPHREITWGGGPSLLAARHRFLFEPNGEKTTVRSVETWTGTIDKWVEPAVRRAAAMIGRHQLAALKRECER